MICTWHTCKEQVAPPKRKFCSEACKNKQGTTDAKRRNKLKLIAHFGGKCTKCGYDKCPAALQFHHPDKNKEFGIGQKQSAAFAKLVAEAEKCVLVCSNCHAEAHWLMA